VPSGSAEPEHAYVRGIVPSVNETLVGRLVVNEQFVTIGASFMAIWIFWPAAAVIANTSS
jgi:hypothetical protein